MTKTISPPSVSTTTSASEPEEIGPQPTGRRYASILESTTWTVETEDGKTYDIRIEGGRGRISFSHGQRHGGEARFYRNATTKVYEAVMSGVKAIYSDRCHVSRVGPVGVTTFSSSIGSVELKPSIAKGKKGRLVEEDEEAF